MTCPYCGKYFAVKQKAVDHINQYHSVQLDKDQMDASQSLYYSTHGSIHGLCMACGRNTEWNYKTGKPYKVCSDPNCRQILSKRADQNMMKIYGKKTLLTDMEHQKKMQEHRPTHDYYVFSDGGKVPYLSKLEKNFLWFCDTIVEMTSNMIQDPPEYFTYFDNKDKVERQYMPDYYLPDYNLLVEIKDGGKHPNTNPAFIEETKYKVKLKDDVMKKQKKYNFIRISDKNYGPFVELLYQIIHVKDDTGMSKNNKNLVVITESACTDADENMNFNQREYYPDMYLSIIVEDDTTHVKGLMISVTSSLSRNYVIDMVNNTAYEATNLQTDIMNELLNPGDEIYTYQYIGDKDKIQEPMYLIIRSCLNHIACDVMTMLKESDIMFSSGFISNNDNKQMDFIYRNC